MTQDQLEWLFYAVWWASRGDGVAKRTLCELLVTDRKRLILSKLRKGDVHESDSNDAHSNIALKVYENIEALVFARAYLRWEERIIREECRKWRQEYTMLGEPLEPQPTER